MEKQARIKSASQMQERAIQLAADEMQHNIKVAAHNQRVMLTGVGEPQKYRSGAFISMIKAARALAAEAQAE